MKCKLELHLNCSLVGSVYLLLSSFSQTFGANYTGQNFHAVFQKIHRGTDNVNIDLYLFCVTKLCLQ